MAISVTGDTDPIEDAPSVLVHHHDDWKLLDPLSPFLNGTFLESFRAVATSDGTTITMSLEQLGGGSLTMVFSDGLTRLVGLDCDPPCAIELTPGSISFPQSNFIFIPKSTKVLTKSLSDWPEAEHIKVAYFFVQSAAQVQSAGPLATHNHNDHVQSTSGDDVGQGHLTHITHRMRHNFAKYEAGIVPTITIVTNAGTPDNVFLSTTAGVVLQLHHHVNPVFDSDPGNGAGLIHVVNNLATPYVGVNDFNTQLLDAAGVSMTNKYFNATFWCAVNETGTHSPCFANLPTGSYNTLSDALADVDGHNVTTMPTAFTTDSPTGFLIARVTFRHLSASGGTWTVESVFDLRGQTPATAVGGGTGLAQTEFADNSFKIFDDGDPTKGLQFQLSAITASMTRLLEAPDQDGKMVVSVAAIADNRLARGDGSGAAIQESPVVVDDSGNMSNVGTLNGRNLATDGTKLDGIETGADVTDAVNVNAAGAVMEADFNTKGDLLMASADDTPIVFPVGANDQAIVSDSTKATGAKWEPVVLNSTFDAQTILAATTDNTPAALAIAEQRLVGRITSGNVAALTAAQVKTMLGLVKSVPIEWPNPVTSPTPDEFEILVVDEAITVNHVRDHVVAGSGTVDYQIYVRDWDGSGSGTTSLKTSGDFQASTTATTETALASSGAVAAGKVLVLKAISQTGSPELVRINIKYTVA